MSEKIKFVIDRKTCYADSRQNLIEAAEDNGIFIPSLCHMKGVIPAGSCRVCNVKVAGRVMTACTTFVADGMEVESDIPELNDLRKSIVEMLFVSGNHFCPACEKSGNCQLQALAYYFRMMVPRFPYIFPIKKMDPECSKLFIERNRCILCKRCIRTLKDEEGRSMFAFKNRGNRIMINPDHELIDKMTDEMAQKAMDTCPVGSILKKEKGFDEPIGQRKYDKKEIGSEIKSVV